MYDYLINVANDDNDTLLVTCPDLPEVTTFAETMEEVERRAIDAINEAVAARLSRFEPIPKASSSHQSRSEGLTVTPNLHLMIKALLLQSLLDQNATRADLVRSLRRNRTEVERLFNPNNKTSLDKYQRAFEALGVKLQLSVADFNDQKSQSIHLN